MHPLDQMFAKGPAGALFLCARMSLLDLLGLGRQVLRIVLVGRHFKGHHLTHLNALFFEVIHLVRIVGQQPDGRPTSRGQHPSRNVKTTRVTLMSQTLIGLVGVQAFILKVVCLELFDQADASALLTEIEYSPSLFLDLLE